MLETRFFVELFFFYALILVNVLIQNKSFPFFTKTSDEWIIDIISLLIQGFFIPIVGALSLASLLDFIIPQFKNSLQANALISFALAFVLVDYVYYWSHRLLHNKKLWHYHIVHHSAEEMDIVNTSRNSLISHFLLPYIWLNGLFIYLLSDPYFYILGFSITSIMDLWRHSKIYPAKTNQSFLKYIEALFITPKMHSWHHSTTEFRSFYGANLVIWDKMHGTYNYKIKDEYPSRMGIKIKRELKTLLLYPHRIFKNNNSKGNSK